MPTATSTLLGRPVWYELMTTDPTAAEAFYRNVIGWTSAPFDGSPNPYVVFKRTGDVQVAGLMKRPDGMNMPPFWAMYVAVPNLEEGVAHIIRLGGTELSPVIDIPNVGRMQMLKDPQGAAFYIIQPDPRDERPEAPAEVGDASWHELMTTDAPAAMKFYSELFGWEEAEAIDIGPMGKYHEFRRPVGMIGGMMNRPPEMASVPPFWAIYFRVADINAAVERITANGGQILNGPMEVPGGDWIVNALDPQGAMFSLHARKTS
jgi:predicted enzyme related to lactoylglutathione lyase